MWVLIIGLFFLLIAAFWHSYSAVGSSAAPIIAPILFGSRRKIDFILVHGWLILFAVGIIILFLENWLVGIIAIPVYWFVLPLLITPFARKWILPSWDDMPDKLKATLEEMGYNGRNYLHGNWWKKDFTKGEHDKLMKEK